jgi:hypothetical protein
MILIDSNFGRKKAVGLRLAHRSRVCPKENHNSSFPAHFRERSLQPKSSIPSSLSLTEIRQDDQAHQEGRRDVRIIFGFNQLMK